MISLKNQVIRNLSKKIFIGSSLLSLKNEEDLKIYFTYQIKKFFDDNNLNLHWNFEHQLKNKKRLDILINNKIIVECKKPNYFSNFHQLSKTKKQIEKYINESFSQEKINCIYYDGYKIGFYENRKFIGEYDINEDTTNRLIYLLLNNEKKVFCSQNLINDLKNTNLFIRLTLKFFYHLQNQEKENKIKILFNEWKRLFNLSENDKNRSEDYLKKIHSLSQIFSCQINENENEKVNKCLFALQSTLAFVLKIISIKCLEKRFNFKDEIINLNKVSIYNKIQLKKFLKDLEYGKIHEKYNIINFFEGDFFGWYLEIFDHIENEIKEVITLLSHYENINYKNEEISNQFFIDLYCSFIPFEIRHSLGEYYTPRWLANICLKEALLHVKTDNNLKILDPACGSGIFLTSYIKHLKKNKNLIKLSDIINNITGIDLNPIAVLHARINYLLNILNLLSSKNKIEIPIYLSDSIYSPSFKLIDKKKYFFYQLDTQIGKLVDIYLPMETKLDDIFFNKLDLFIKNEIPESIIKLFKSKKINSQEELKLLKKMALQLIDLHKNKWNGIWVNIIKQFYKSSKIREVDLIIGNPPWISWIDLPQNYRERIKLLDNIKSIFGISRNIGGNNLNVCALMANLISSQKLNQFGCLAFIMPKSLLFNSSYEGFRPFYLQNKNRLYLQKYFNFDNVKNVFEEVNLNFGIYFFSYKKINYQLGVKQVIFSSKEKIKNINFLVSIQNKTNAFSQVKDEEELNNFKLIQSDNFFYKFRSGVSVVRKDICRFFILKIYNQNYTWFVRNNKKGKIVKNTNILEGNILLENKVMYPYVTSSNLSPFELIIKNSEWVFFPYDIKNNSRQPYNTEKIANFFPKLSSYLLEIKELLKSKSSYSQRIQNVSQDFGLLRIGKYTFHENFVCCRNNTKWIASYANRILSPWNEKKLPLFESHISYISEDKMGISISKNEAYYITAILNSPIIKQFVENSNVARNYSFNNLSIFLPKYNEKNKLHFNLMKITFNIIELKKEFNDYVKKQLNALYLQLCKEENK